MVYDDVIDGNIIRLIEEALDKISTIKQQEAGEKSRASRQQTQPPLSIEDIQTRYVCECVLCICKYASTYRYVYFVCLCLCLCVCLCVCTHACVCRCVLCLSMCV